MLLVRLVLSLLIACGSGYAVAQNYDDDYDYAYDFEPRTGDAYFDACLGDINAWGSVDLELYVDEVVISTGAPRRYVEEYVIERRYPPADVWMIAEMSRVSGQSFSSVATTYSANRTEGWGAMAKRLGIKPGSAEFHAMKGRTGKQRDSWKAKGRPAHAASSRRATTTAVTTASSGTTVRGNSAGKGQGKVKAAKNPSNGKAKEKGKSKGKGKGKD